MPDLVLRSPSIERARAAIAGEARRVPAAVDAVAPVPAAIFGPLTSALEVVAVLHEITDALGCELGVGGQRLDEVDRGLDAVLRVLQSSDTTDASALGRM